MANNNYSFVTASQLDAIRDKVCVNMCMPSLCFNRMLYSKYTLAKQH